MTTRPLSDVAVATLAGNNDSPAGLCTDAPISPIPGSPT